MSCLGDEALLSNKNRANGCPEAFAKAEGNRVEGAAELLQGGTRLDGDVPEPSAIKMELGANGVGVGRDSDDLVLRDDGAIEGVLKSDDLCGGAALESTSA